MKIALYVAFSNSSTVNCCKDVIDIVSAENHIIIDSKIKSELSVVIQNKSLLIFLLGSLFIQASWGLANSLSFLTFTSFWDLTPLEIRFFL